MLMFKSLVILRVADHADQLFRKQALLLGAELKSRSDFPEFASVKLDTILDDSPGQKKKV
jgi:hypothetical protein